MDELSDEFSASMIRIEEYLHKLLDMRFDSAADLWRMEQDLLHYQVELQEALAGEKASHEELREAIAAAASTKVGDWKVELQQLQDRLREKEQRIKIVEFAHLCSKRLGDTLAWLLMKLDGNNIGPLTRNLRVPATSSGYSLKGVLAVAEMLANAGAGFPVVHDMTDCLRVGDVTFVLPDHDPLTIEVKTHLRETRNGVMELGVEVHLVGDENDAARWEEINSHIPVDQNALVEGTSVLANIPVHVVKPLSPQLKRQLKRMADAKAWQSAATNQVVKLSTGEGLAVQYKLDGTEHHWNDMRDAAIAAKLAGFAYRTVDDAFVYTAMYMPEPMVYPHVAVGTLPFGSDLPKALLSSGILYPDPAKNSLWFGTSWTHFTDERFPQLLPIFLYPFPQELIVDMLWQRLSLGVYVNLGKVVSVLEEAGLNARLPTKESELSEHFLSISKDATLADGTIIRVDVHGMNQYAAKTLYECLSLQGFVRLVSDVANAITEHTEQMATEHN